MFIFNYFLILWFFFKIEKITACSFKLKGGSQYFFKLTETVNILDTKINNKLIIRVFFVVLNILELDPLTFWHSVVLKLLGLNLYNPLLKIFYMD